MLRICFLAAALIVSSSGHAQSPSAPGAGTPASASQDVSRISDVNELLALTQQQSDSKNWDALAATWGRLAQLRPHLGFYQLEQAATHALQGKRSEAYTLLLEMQKQGYGFDPNEDARFKPVADTPAWTYIVENLAQNSKPIGSGKVAYTLKNNDQLLESIAWDPSRKKLLVGSVRDGAVFVADASGALSPLVRADADNGLWGVMDIAVDAERNVLWIASTAVPHFKGYSPEKDLGRAGVFKFDLKTGKFLKRYLSPSVLGHNFFISTLALGPDGTIYAADGVNNALYMVRDDQLTRTLHAPMLSGIRGLAISGDNRALYLSDVERGLFAYDLASGEPFDIRVPKTLALAGIESLSWWKGQLVAVQSGMRPYRVLKLGLSPDGRSIASSQVIESATEALTEPTLSTVNADTVYVIANSQKKGYDRFGLAKKRDKIENMKILAVDLNFMPPEQSQKPQ